MPTIILVLPAVLYLLGAEQNSEGDGEQDDKAERKFDSIALHR